MRSGRKVLLVVMLSGLSLSLLLANWPAQPGLAQSDPLVELPGSLPPELGSSTPSPNAIGTHPAVSLVLTPRNSAILDKLIRQVQDPKSPRYRQFLTTVQYRQQFAPASQDIDALKQYFSGQGLQVAYASPDNFVLTLSGTPTQLDRAFGTHSEYRANNRGQRGYVNTTALRLPASLAVKVRGVSGFDSLHTPKTHTSVQADPVASENTPDSLRHAYGLDVTGQTGAGSRVGIVLWSAPDQNSLQGWQSYYGHNLNLTVIGNQAISQDVLGLEADMDVEMVHLAAPSAQIRFYSAYSNSDGDLTRMISTAINDNIVALSGSWGQCERDISPTTLSAYHTLFQQAAALGVSLFFSSGDNGIFDCGSVGYSQYPAGDDLVTSVGATRLSRDSVSNAWAGETAWSCPPDNDSACTQLGGGSSGGGATVNITRPFYQSGITPPTIPNVVNTASNTRVQPDISMDGDPTTGVLVYFTGGGYNNNYYSGGTSASAPLLAGLMAQAAQQAGGAVGSLNPFLYSQSGASWLWDISAGYNGTNAGSGWDYTTGMGSIRSAGDFLNAFVGATSRPYLRVASFSADDNGPGNNNNHVIDPGEIINLQIGLTNYGSASSSAVASLNLAQPYNYVSLQNTNSAYPQIDPGSSAGNANLLTLKVLPGATCGDVIKLSLYAIYGNNYRLTYNFNLVVGLPSYGATLQPAYSGPALSIPDDDPNGLTSQLTVNSSARVADVNVHLNISHTYDSDLTVTLISPAGTRIKLIDRRGGSGHDFTNTTLDDAASIFIGDQVNATPPYTGTYQPEGSLSSLVNEPAGGNWKLLVVDNASQDTGTLNSWSLDIIPATYSCSPLPNPVPVLTSLVPATVPAGMGDFTLALNGSNFVSGSVVKVNGANRATTYGGSNELLVTIKQSEVASAGSLSLTVFNPTPAGGTSGAQTLTIRAGCQPLIITSLATTSSCGTLPYALAQAGPGATLNFALLLNSPQTINLGGSVNLPSGAKLLAPCLPGSGPAVLLPGAGLNLAGGNTLSGLRFGAKPIRINTGGNHFSCTRFG